MAPGRMPSLPREGDIVAGKYRVERVLGKGGMGVVVVAEHLGLHQRFAVKFLRPEALGRAEAHERFVREAQAAAAIQSDHVAKIIDVGTQESGAPYIVMEHLTGRDLQDLLRERGPLPPGEAVGYLLEACEALAEAHALGIVHRDLKPSNLFLASRVGGPPVVKILDFGLAKAISSDAADANEESITTTNLVMGSVHYMSPEQMRSLKQADSRSDIWSLGVILYELVSGVRPFQGDSLPASLLMIGLDPPRPLRPGTVPPQLEAVIMRCLEKDRAARPQTIAELARLLAPFASPVGRASVERILASQLQVEPSSPSSNWSEDTTRSTAPLPAAILGRSAEALADTKTRTGWSATLRPSRRGLLWMGAALLVSAAAGGAYGMLRSADSEPEVEIEADRLASFSPLPREIVFGSPLERTRAELGKLLFADRRLSRNGDVACASCHPLDRHGADGQRLSRGTGGREPPRNTLGIYNVAGFFALLWDGRRDNLVDQAKEVLLSPRVMAVAGEEELAAALRAIPEYAAGFAAAFPDDTPPVSFDNIARALAAYESTLISRGRWDRFLEGDREAVSEEEKAGFNRFIDVGCVTCHFGPNVGATMFQKVGLVKAWPRVADRGRFEITKRDVDWMVFRVPTLRNVEKTGPYFHDGSVADLDTAIEMMAWHQLGKRLAPDDVRLIRGWLATLTGEPVRLPEK